MPYITVGRENGANIDLYYKDWGLGQPVIRNRKIIELKSPEQKSEELRPGLKQKSRLNYIAVSNKNGSLALSGDLKTGPFGRIGNTALRDRRKNRNRPYIYTKT